MGAASCKNSTSPSQDHKKEQTKNITIGVFGLDDAGKTSTVKAIEGDPTENVTPTVSSTTTTVTNPLAGKDDRTNKNANQSRVKIIDVSGSRKFRQQSWSQFYEQIHGLIFVIDASDKFRFTENQDILEGLLEHDQLKNKPVLILANKQDERNAIKTETELRRKLNIERLKNKHKIELCTALPQAGRNKVDESIGKGFSWLIKIIDDNYTDLNARVLKPRNPPINRKPHRSDSDDNDSDHRSSKGKTSTSRITSEKLPSIDPYRNRTRTFDDDDDNDDDKYNHTSRGNSFNKKKKVIGASTSNDISSRKSNTSEPKAFRSTYESFPEESPWTSSSLKHTKSDDILPKLTTKSSFTNEPRRRDVSPLVHDTKPYTNSSLSRRDYGSDNENDYTRQQRWSNQLNTTTKKSTSALYDDDDDDYSKKPYDNNKKFQGSSGRVNLDDEYRGTSSTKTSTRFRADDDDRPPAYGSRFNKDDDYSPSRSNARSTYNNNNSNYSSSNTRFNRDDDDDDNHRWSSSKPTSNTNSKRFQDDDDDDDDYLNASRRNTGGTNTSNRFRKTTGYDS